jgi:hypothetical protein
MKNIIIALFLIVVAISQSNNNEGFNSVSVVTLTSANVADYIYRQYQEDVKAIQKLADFAMQLQAGGITCPGNFAISGKTNINNTLDIIGNTTVSGNLSIKDNATISTLNITNNATVGGNITVGGNMIAKATTVTSIVVNSNNSSLGLDGTNRLKGGLYLENGIIGDGASDLSKAMTIDSSGNVNINGNITINGFITLGSNKTVLSANGTKIILRPAYSGVYNASHNKYIGATPEDSLTTNLIIGPKNIPKTDSVTKENGYGYGYVDSSGFWLSSNLVRLDGCDKRIKYNIQNANSNELLNKINSLPLQNYNFIDKKYYEGKTIYGLIAQDVKKILPEAVTIIKEYIPNINKIVSFYEMNNKIILEVSNNTKTNDNIKLIINEMPFYTKVIDSTYNSITIDKWSNYNNSDNVLVYGTMIDDFHTLNQSYLGVLSLGGIRQLSKQIKFLHKDNKNLKDKLEYLLNKY